MDNIIDEKYWFVAEPSPSLPFSHEESGFGRDIMLMSGALNSHC